MCSLLADGSLLEGVEVLTQGSASSCSSGSYVTCSANAWGRETVLQARRTSQLEVCACPPLPRDGP